MRAITTLVLMLLVVVGCEPDPVVFVDVSLGVVGQGTIRVVYDGDASADELNVEVAVCEADDPCDLEARQGSLLSAQARAARGFVFSGWQGRCAELVDDVADVVIDDSLDCVAVFSLDPQVVAEGPTLSLDVVGPGRLITTPALLDCHGTDPASSACTGQFLQGSLVSVRAIADSGAAFAGFFDDCDSFDDVAQVSMSADRRCGATFIEDDVRFPVRVEVTGRGTVRSSPSGISCGDGGSRCRGEFAAGTLLTLDAQPSPGSVFVGWGHACDGVLGSSFDLEVQFAVACSASFSRTFQVGIVGDGVVSSDDDVCTFGPCTWSAVPPSLNAEPAPGSRFVSWSGDCSGAAPTIDVDPDWISCTARFEPIPPQLTVTVDGPGRVVADNADPISCPDDCVSEGGGAAGPGVDPGPGLWVCEPSYYDAGDGCDCGCGIPDPDCGSSAATACSYCSGGCGDSCSDIASTQNHLCVVESLAPTLRVVAVPNERSTFVGWSGDCFGASTTIDVVLSQPLACTARFARELVVESVGPGSVSAGALTCTSRCATTTIPNSLVAQPAATARLVRWEGDCARADAPLSIPVGDDVGLCRAVFATIPPRLTLLTDGPGDLQGVANCAGGCVLEGTTQNLSVDVVAAPRENALFAGWSGDCTGTQPSLRITVSVATEQRCTATFLSRFSLEIVSAHNDVDVAGLFAVDKTGSTLSMVENGRAITRRDLRTGAVQHTVSPASAGVVHTLVGLVDPGSDELLVLGGGVDHRAFVFGDDGVLRSSLNAPHAAPLSSGAIGVDSDADVVCTGDESGRVKVWSKATGLVQRTLLAHEPVSVLALGVVSGLIVSAGADGVVALRRTTASAVVDTETAFVSPATAAAFGGNHVVLGDETGTIAVVDVDVSLRRLVAARTVRVPGAVRTVAVGETVALAGLDDGSAVRIDLASLAMTPLATDDVVLVAAGGDALVVSTPTSVLALTPDGSERRVWTNVLGADIGGVVVTDSASLAYDGRADRLVRVEDHRLSTIPGRAAHDAATHGDTIYLASAAGGIESVSATTGTIRRVTPATDDLSTVRVSPQGELLAATTSSATTDVVIFETAIGEVFRTYADASGVVVDLDFIDDDHVAMLVDTGSDGRLSILQVSTNTVIDNVSLSFEPKAMAMRDGEIAVAGRVGLVGRVLVVETSTIPVLVFGPPLSVPAAVVDVAFAAPSTVYAVDTTTLYAVDFLSKTVRASAPIAGTVRGIVAAPGPLDDDDAWTTSSEGLVRWRLHR
jgi:WD40 repeat protein